MELNKSVGRRSLLRGGAAAAALLSLPACATYPGFSLTEAVRRLLLLSSERAFLRLTQPDGFWDQQVAQLGLAQLLGARGDAISRVLTSGLFKERLEDKFADIAIDASYRAAPIVTDAVEIIGLANAAAIVSGGPRAATEALRGEVGLRLLDAMVPELGDALRIASDPLVAELLNAATGSDVGSTAQRFAENIDNAIWTEIGREEAAIRADPGASGDPMLRAVFGAAGAF